MKENKPIYYAKINYIKPKSGYDLTDVTVYNLKDYDEKIGPIPFKMIKEANMGTTFVFSFYEDNKDSFINVSKDGDDYITDGYPLDVVLESYLELKKDYGYKKEDINRDNLKEYIKVKKS